MERFISVIMPSFDGGEYIEEAIISCIKQPYLLELIIFEGGSDILTKKKIISLSKKYSKLKFFFEKDEGPGHALNKALLVAKGSYIAWLNSDDKFEPEFFKNAVDVLISNKKVMFLYGHGKYIDKNGDFIGYYPTLKPNAGIKSFDEGCFICQPTILINKKLIHKLGNFDINLEACFDMDLWLRVFKKLQLKQIGFIDKICGSTRIHENTITSKEVFKSNIESAFVLKKYLNSFNDHWLEQAARSIIYKKTYKFDKYFNKNKSNLNYKNEVAERFNKIYKGYINNLNKQNLEIIQKRNDLPLILKLILMGRNDLQEEGFHLPENEMKFCTWLFIHGIKEYPNFFKGNNTNNPILEWFNKNNFNSTTRIKQCFFDLYVNRDFKFLVKYRVLSTFMILIIWRKYFKDKQLNFYSFFSPPYQSRLDKMMVSISNLSLKISGFDQYKGVNIIGHLEYSSGLFQDLLTTNYALKKNGLSTKILNYDLDNKLRNIDEPLFEKVSKKEDFALSILCLSPIECLNFLSLKDKYYFRKKYLIAYVPSELETWPKELDDLFCYVNEVWTPSKFIYDSLCRKKTLKKLMPLCVDYPDERLKPLSDYEKSLYRKKFNIPLNKFIFICSFDLESFFERKNPWASIKAFQKAFDTHYPNNIFDSEACLIIKTFKTLNKNREWDLLRVLAKMDRRIIIIEEDMNHIELMKLYGCSDCLISLHRSEGFGRILAECLQLGLEVVTTRWSGNLDFCEDEFVHLIPYELVKILPGSYPNWSNQNWAEPDNYAAASKIKAVANGLKINKNIDLNKFSANICGQRFYSRINEILRKLSNK